jgi:Flp pilus assembly protein TadB
MKLPAYRPHQAIAVLLVVAAGLFVIGVTSEGDEDNHNEEPAAETDEHNEQAETGETTETEAAERAESQEAEEDEERVLGMDVESPLLITAAVVMSLLLAGLVWRRPDRRLLIVITVIAAGFAVLDAAEVVHQLDEDRTGLAALAGVIAALHAAAAALAIQQTTTAATGYEPAAS